MFSILATLEIIVNFYEYYKYIILIVLAVMIKHGPFIGIERLR